MFRTRAVRCRVNTCVSLRNTIVYRVFFQIGVLNLRRNLLIQQFPVHFLQMLSGVLVSSRSNYLGEKVRFDEIERVIGIHLQQRFRTLKDHVLRNRQGLTVRRNNTVDQQLGSQLNRGGFLRHVLEKHLQELRVVVFPPGDEHSSIQTTQTVLSELALNRRGAINRVLRQVSRINLEHALLNVQRHSFVRQRKAKRFIQIDIAITPVFQNQLHVGFVHQGGLIHAFDGVEWRTCRYGRFYCGNCQHGESSRIREVRYHNENWIHCNTASGAVSRKFFDHLLFWFLLYNRKRVLAASSQDWQLTPFNRSLRKHASGVYLEADYGTLNPIV